LIRTSNRKELFSECINNIRNATLIVSYDTTETEKYVKETCNSINRITYVNLIEYRGKLHPNQYIEHMLQHIDANCWVMILDDDDKFTDINAYQYLCSQLIDIDNIYIWKFHRCDRYIYPLNKQNPQVGEIATCNYIYHSSHLLYNIWKNATTGISDYTYFAQLRKTKNKIKLQYIDMPLTRINYTDKISGWSAN
jgi:hypothetical protein